jgi:hypothetical protein
LTHRRDDQMTPTLRLRLCSGLRDNANANTGTP